MFGRSKSHDGNGDGVARVVKHKEKTESEATVSDRWGTRPIKGRYEARCDEDSYSLTGLRKKDAEAFAEIHDYERHGRR